MALCAAMVFGIAAAPVAAHAQSRRVDRPAAILTVISGDVLVRTARGDFSSALDGTVLYVGTMLRTSADARALITLFEGSTLQLDPASDITIEMANMRGDATIAQSLGRSWNVVMHLTTADSRYEPTTPAATASVRGGEFEVDGASGMTAIFATTEQRVPTTAAVQTSATVVTSTQTTAAPVQTATVSTRTAQSAELVRRAIAQSLTTRAQFAARARDRSDEGERQED